MKNPELLTEDGIHESFLILFKKENCNVMVIQDAVEESVTGVDLVNRLNALKLFSRFSLDRETSEYARLITVDCWGNTHYLKAWK